MTKQELRKIYLQKRSSLTPAEYGALNEKICESFFLNIDLSTVNVLHLFLPIKKFNEPNTWLIVERLKKEFPHIKLSVPKVKAGSNDLEHFYLEHSQQFQLSDWEIPEPDFGNLTDIAHMDMILVPLLIFDRRGHRVGYGKGFYDKFLSTASPNCKKVGLSFFPPVDTIEINEHDQPLDIVVTSEGVYFFK